VRPVIFVGLIVSLVGAYCCAMGRALPRSQNEPGTLLLLPWMVICDWSLLLSPALCRQRQRSGQAVALYIGFVPSTVVYGGYL
jgi:hypothetical protein